MSKTEAKQPTPIGDLVKPVRRELEQSALKQVTAGKVAMSDVHFVRKADKASPQF